MPWTALLAAFVLALALCWLIIRLGVKDAPDGGRKDQPRPVATLGGLAIAGAHILVVLLLTTLPPPRLKCGNTLWAPGSIASYWPFIPAMGVLLIGTLDDLRPVPASVRMIGLAAICLATCAVAVHSGYSYLPDLPGWTLAGLVAGGALYIFVLLNATNFMDGSNGLAMGCAAIMLAVLAWLVAPPIWILVAAIAGFLVFNLAGVLYAGDAGALYAGFWIAALGLWGTPHAYSIWIPPLIALPFLTDVFMTLIWRAGRGQNLMQAHRDHAYQLFLRTGWSHFQVAALWWTMTAACGALAIWAVRAARPEPSLHPLFWIEFAAFAGALAFSLGLWLVQRAVLGPRVSSAG
jgi:UDP-N-acetylmuramyl pentapeptide phosphotransferase/UDP-N-acetylglucosamine-1-phosphate transferase